MTTETTEATTPDPSVGATADIHLVWHQINWRKAECTVRRLQSRIAQATQARRWGKVKALQRLLTHSLSGKALAVRRVTENTGKRTPGVDGAIWNTPEQKAEAIQSLTQRGYHPLPLRRIYISKSNGERRPLSFPTMRDRAMQALYLLALDPVSETTADPNSYGFRRGRSTADAIEACFIALCQKDRAQWILEGDIRSCFDRTRKFVRRPIPMIPPGNSTSRNGLMCRYLRCSREEDGCSIFGRSNPVFALSANRRSRRLLAGTATIFSGDQKEDQMGQKIGSYSIQTVITRFIARVYTLRNRVR